ncbi:MAG: hypothetical protein A3H27_01340 [Acidobacteria bacterium RIFCSPLOWO2_02_FULL_59_13]|nr:MAG: hypothetical protein A3H27_01340 [Acidobacteria bacterium RIFCSPLOWO2_02_FULL_59_13]
MDRELYQRHAELCKVFFHPARLELLHILRREELSVSELARRLGLAIGNLSQHLGMMKQRRVLLAQVEGTEIPAAILSQMVPWRVRRKKLAAFCLFVVITLVLLGLQVYSRFDPLLTGLLLLLAALFSWRVYKTPVSYGWI